MDKQGNNRTVDIQSLSRRYMCQGVAMAIAMFLLGCVAYGFAKLEAVFVPSVIGAGFSILVVIADSVVWRRVAERSPENLTTFYTAVSGFRLLLALATMFVYYIVAGSESMRVFFFVFMAFYVVQLVHHSVFFAKVSNRS